MTHLLLPIPDHLYNRARQIAEETSRPVEEVLLQHLEEALSDSSSPQNDEEAELDALSHLSEDVLWMVAREQMPAEKNERLVVLMDKNSDGTISSEEHAELEALVEQGQRLMLRKGKAALLLTQRGYKISLSDLEPRSG